MITWLRDIIKNRTAIFAGTKRILTGFLFFCCCLSVYFGISALLSQFLYDKNTNTENPAPYAQENASSQANQKEPEAQPEQLNEANQQEQNVLKNKGFYRASDIHFIAYNAHHDPFYDLEKNIQQNYPYDKELLTSVRAVHKAVDSFLKQEIPQKSCIYADNGIHFTKDKKAYPFIVYQLVHDETPEYMYYLGKENEAFFEKFKTYMQAQNPSCSVHFENNFYYVVYKGQITHVIRLKELKERIAVFSLLASYKSYISLILDDAGENMALARQCMDLPYPVIFSIWPESTHAVMVAVLAHEKGLPVYLHQPMEALPRNGQKVDIGKSGLYTSMTYEQMRDVLYQNLLSLPYVQGMNNHMGSKFSLDKNAIIKFYKAVQDIKPYFLVLDSITTPQSKIYRIGKENGFLVAKRDIFIDNEADKKSILQELDHAHELAKKHKRVVVIGHVRKATVQALKEWQAYKDQNIVFSLPSTF